MARARNIKPAFFINDKLGDLEPLARLLFIGLWTIADYKGDLEYRPAKIKAQLLPYDNCSIEDLIASLVKSRFLITYTDGENNYLRIPKFSDHQNPHPHEKNKGSTIPPMEDCETQAIESRGEITSNDKSLKLQDLQPTDRADSLIPDPDSLTPDSLERGAQKKAPAKRERFTPPSFQEVSDYFFQKGGDSTEAEKFMAFYESKGWLVGKVKMKDWQAAVRGWIARNKDSQKKPGTPSNEDYYQKLANRNFE